MDRRLYDKVAVSIHALLAECDPRIVVDDDCPDSFNPRTPCGVRQTVSRGVPVPESFQSTHSLRSATGVVLVCPGDAAVSIHALLAECDADKDQVRFVMAGFNPRTPCGVRLRPTLYIATQQSKSYFAPTSLKRPSLHGCSF